MSRKTKAAAFVDEEYSLTITGRNVQVTESMKDYAIEKISKIEKFNLRLVDVLITMDIQKISHRVDIVVKVDHIAIKVHAITDNMYASIDMAVDKLENKIRRYHSRIRDHQTRGLPATDMNVSVLRPSDEDLLDMNGDIESANQHELLNKYRFHEIVNEEKLPLKWLSNDEAILKMELSGDAFLVFRSESDRKLKVIYRRNDGHYGLISPEV